MLGSTRLCALNPPGSGRTVPSAPTSRCTVPCDTGGSARGSRAHRSSRHHRHIGCHASLAGGGAGCVTTLSSPVLPGVAASTSRPRSDVPFAAVGHSVRGVVLTRGSVRRPFVQNAESGALARVSRYRKEAARQHRPAGVVGRSCLRAATTSRSSNAHCAGVSGWMFLLLWNTFSGSYFAFTSASRR